jgi:hypothetical protein
MEHNDNILQESNAEVQGNNLPQNNTVGKKYLISKLNQINFNNGTVQVNLKHTKYNNVISCFANPQPCFDNQLECLWNENNSFGSRLKSYKFDNLIVTNGHKTFLVTSDLTSINETGISLLLPETCSEIDYRKTRRYLCDNISAQLVQNGALFYGYLNNFSANSFHVIIKTTPPQTPQWINEGSSINAIFYDNNETLYSGTCEIINKMPGRKGTIGLALKTTDRQLPRYSKRQIRSKRQALLPSLNIMFTHPFTKKMVTLKSIDFSESGFGVEENESESVLLPGMIISKLNLTLANMIHITCRAQVVYKINSSQHSNAPTSRSGIAILDMNPNDHLKYFSLLNQVKNEHFYISSNIETDTLWDCLFETGLIDPDMYDFIYTHRENIRKTFHKLQALNSDINRHFIYRENGAVAGQMSMLRFYNDSWLLHHNAIHKLSEAHAAPVLLDQIANFIYNSNRLYSLHIGYVFSYLSEDNTFLNRIFNNYAKNIKHPKLCSIDQFACFRYKKTEDTQTPLPFGWELSETTYDDLAEFVSFYEDTSGGLMLTALELAPEIINDNKMFHEYKKAGLKRERLMYSLKKGGDLKTIIIANISEIGLDISDLTNCIKIVVLEPESISNDIFYSTVASISKKYEQKETTILVNPVVFADNSSIPCEKRYNLWILNADYSESFVEYIQGIS